MPNFVIGLALVAGLAAPAFAGSQIDVMAAPQRSQTQTLQVRYSDLNLADARGMNVLNNRIALAANQVCNGDKLYSLEARSDYLTCRRSAMNDAQTQVQQRIARDGGAPIAFPVG